MTLRQLTALVAVFAVLVVITVSVLPGHGHSDSARTCDICHSGHLPCLESSGQIQLYTEMPVVWQHAAEHFEPYVETTFAVRSPRAPPA